MSRKASGKGAKPTRARSAKKRILHLHSAFDPGGKELRAVELMNAFGPNLEHTIVSGDPGKLGAAELVNKRINVRYPDDFPSLRGKPFPRRLKKLADAMKPFDLVLTYNWGAMDAVLAHTVFATTLKLPWLIHHEDGFNEDEADKLSWKRNWFRRIALGRTSALVVPSETLETIALNDWQQPTKRLRRIPNGVDTRAFAGRGKPDALGSVTKQKGDLWVGTMAGLRAVKNLPALVRAFAPLPEPWKLVILGEGPERDAIEQQAQALGIGERVHLPGFADPAKVAPLFDIFALSSHSEQFPISVVEAMASGLPVAAPAVGDVVSIVAPANGAFISLPGDEAALARSLAELAADADMRFEVGEANRRKAVALFDRRAMIDSYSALYSRAMGLGKMP